MLSAEWVSEMCEKWPSLRLAEYNKLMRAGFHSYEELIEAIKRYGLFKRGDFCSIGEGGPYVRQAGAKTWRKYLAMLDSVGFDWRAYLVGYGKPPESEIEYRQRIEKAIDKLSELLREYREKYMMDSGEKLR